MSDFPETLTFEMLKSNSFRVTHADGAILGATPHGLSIAFYSERQPIPSVIVQRVNRDGSIGEELTDQRQVRKSIIRDTEVVITLGFDTARGLYASLGTLLEQVEQLKTRDVSAQVKH